MSMMLLQDRQELDVGRLLGLKFAVEREAGGIGRTQNLNIVNVAHPFLSRLLTTS